VRNSRNDFDPNAYNPTFQRRFLSPSHWSEWLLVALALPVALLPNFIRFKIANFAAGLMIHNKSKAVHRAWVNLTLCFPDKSSKEKLAIIRDGFASAGTYLLSFPRLTLRSKDWLEKNSVITGLENLTRHTDNNENIILLVPHTWTIDIPAVLLASKGLPVVGFVKKQKSEINDWLMHKQRIQYGGRIYERSAGIKHFVRSVKQGYLGYYLPDQDHGPEHSVFTKFFSATKATLPGLGKVAKISKAKVVPIFSSYNTKTGKYEIDIYPALQNFPTGSDEGDARVTNEYIESVVIKKPEQYMWNLSLLKTQQNGENPYKQLASKEIT